MLRADGFLDAVNDVADVVIGTSLACRNLQCEKKLTLLSSCSSPSLKIFTMCLVMSDLSLPNSSERH